jgi:hypothetical protein
MADHVHQKTGLGTIMTTLKELPPMGAFYAHRRPKIGDLRGFSEECGINPRRLDK